jgi:hypothetical protein
MAMPVVGCTAQSTAGTSPTADTAQVSAFNATDTAWILLMIPMTERAQLLTDLVPSHTADPALTVLAAKTGSALRDDLRRLRAVLQLSGVPDTHPHEGHNMPGMVSLGTLRKAAATNGQAFDQILTGAHSLGCFVPASEPRAVPARRRNWQQPSRRAQPNRLPGWTGCTWYGLRRSAARPR